MTHRTTMNRATVLAVAACAGLALASCGSSAGTSATSSTGSTTSTSSTSPASESGLTMTDAWVKSAPALPESKMIGSFGQLKNTTGKDITVVSGTQDASEVTELHEVATIDGIKKMRQIQGGFVIKAGETMTLKPGANHIMIMKMTKPLPDGTQVTFTLTTSEGKKLQYKAVVKPFTMPEENYVSNTGAATTK